VVPLVLQAIKGSRPKKSGSSSGSSGGAGYQEDETGLQLLGHRYYDPSTGRFLTRDPIKDGRNWYSYCDNNPVNCIDAVGLKPGDLFDSEEAAMKDAFGGSAGESWNQNREFGGYIYRIRDKKTGKWKYGYTKVKGDATSVNISPTKSDVPEGAEITGNWHTHESLS
jgi:RHS repeat-associated protein